MKQRHRKALGIVALIFLLAAEGGFSITLYKFLSTACLETDLPSPHTRQPPPDSPGYVGDAAVDASDAGPPP